jgi:hypothetical protein
MLVVSVLLTQPRFVAVRRAYRFSMMRRAFRLLRGISACAAHISA